MHSWGLILVAVILAVLLGWADTARNAKAAAWTVTPGPALRAEPLTGGPLDGVLVTRLSNYTVANEEPFPFDHQVSGWATTDPGVLVAPTTGWYWVGADITTLGTAYGGPTNAYEQVSVLRNWDGEEPRLHATIAFENFYATSGDGAHGNSLLQPVYLEVGDRLQLWVIGGPGGLLVESNPSDGLPSGFPTDTGPGTLSPRFYLLPL